MTDPGEKVVTTEAGTKVTVTVPAEKVTVTTPSSPSRRSEALTITLLGLGVVTVLAGAFYSRISSITFPGGAGIGLAALTNTSAELEARLKNLEESLGEVKSGGEVTVKQLVDLQANVTILKETVKWLLERLR